MNDDLDAQLGRIFVGLVEGAIGRRLAPLGTMPSSGRVLAVVRATADHLRLLAADLDDLANELEPATRRQVRLERTAAA